MAMPLDYQELSGFYRRRDGCLEFATFSTASQKHANDLIFKCYNLYDTKKQSANAARLPISPDRPHRSFQASRHPSTQSMPGIDPPS